MKFKHRIWLLPIMTAVIVTVGIAVNSQIISRTSAALTRVEKVQYPTVEALRAVRTDVVDIQELLQRSVAEGDAAAIATTDQHAQAVRESLKELARLDPDSASAARLKSDFDAYYAAAVAATRIML